MGFSEGDITKSYRSFMPVSDLYFRKYNHNYHRPPHTSHNVLQDPMV